MSMESKEIYVGTVNRKTEEIELRKNFGWSYLEDKHHGRSGGLHIVLIRDTNMKNYNEIYKLEQRYDKCKSQLRTYFPITDSPEMFLLILVFVIPFVLYCLYKSNQKEEIRRNNEALNKEMDNIVASARLLVY